MKTLLSKVSCHARTLFVAPFTFLILMYIAYQMGKSLDSFIPCWIVWLVLAANSFRINRQNKSCHLNR